jgi:hypothetical protein
MISCQRMDNIMHGDNNTTKKRCLVLNSWSTTFMIHMMENQLPPPPSIVVVVQQLCLACKSSANYFCPMCFGRARKKLFLPMWLGWVRKKKTLLLGSHALCVKTFISWYPDVKCEGQQNKTKKKNPNFTLVIVHGCD